MRRVISKHPTRSHPRLPDCEHRYTLAPGATPSVTDTRTGDPGKFAGYAAVFYDRSKPGTEYRLFEDVVERIAPGAFDKTVREDDILASYNHDLNLLLGRTSAHTMRLTIDKVGLFYEITPGNTNIARDMADWLRRGEVRGSSFMFRATGEDWTRENGMHVRTLTEMRCFECGPVATPAYQASTAGIREQLHDYASDRIRQIGTKSPTPLLDAASERIRRLEAQIREERINRVFGSQPTSARQRLALETELGL